MKVASDRPMSESTRSWFEASVTGAGRSRAVLGSPRGRRQTRISLRAARCRRRHEPPPAVLGGGTGGRGVRRGTVGARKSFARIDHLDEASDELAELAAVDAER